MTQALPDGGVFCENIDRSLCAFGIRTRADHFTTQLLPSNMAKVKLRFRDVTANQTPFTGTLNLNQHLARVRAGKQPDESVRCFFQPLHHRLTALDRA